MKKKYLRRAFRTIAVPFVLFFLLCLLIYLPPVQNFLVDRVAAFASEATGMSIRVGRVALSFPLRLVVTDVEAASAGGDTLLSVRRLQADVQLLPLLRKRVEVDGITLQGVDIDTDDLINGLQLKGTLGELFVSSHGVELNPETAVVNRFLLKDTDLSLSLNDTARADTAQADTVYWKFILDDIALQNVSFSLRMPADSLSLALSVGEARLRDGLVDLHRAAYSLRTFRLDGGRVALDTGLPLAAKDSLSAVPDPAHLSLTGIGLQLDSLYYEGRDMRATLRELKMRERSGLEVTSAEARLSSDARTLHMPFLRMSTSDSYVELNASLPWDALDGRGGGDLSLRFMADVGKPDVLRLSGRPDKAFARLYPSEPMHVRAGVDGTTDALRLTALTVELPGAVSLRGRGELTSLTDSLRRGGELTLEAEAGDLRFISALCPGLEIPQGTRLDGRFSLAGPQMEAGLLLRQPGVPAVTEGGDTLHLPRSARLLAGYDSSRDGYDLRFAADELDLHRFLTADSLYVLTARLEAKGEGFDFFSPRTRLGLEGHVDRFRYGSRDLSGLSFRAALERQTAEAALSVKNGAVDADARLDGRLKPHDTELGLDVDVRRIDWRALGLTDVPLTTSQRIGIRLASDLERRYDVEAEMTGTVVTTPRRTAQAKDLFAGFVTGTDSTRAWLRAGDLDLLLQGEGSLETISAQADALMRRASEQWDGKRIDQEALRPCLPSLCLRASSGPDNPVANYLSMTGVAYDNLYLDIDSSPAGGLNGEMWLRGLHTDSLTIDTLSFDVRQDTTAVRFVGDVASGPRPGQEAFDARLEGSVGDGNARLLLQYFNARREEGVHIGVAADLRRHGIRLKFFPEQPVLVYRPFMLNPDNYVYLSERGRVHANVTLRDEQGSGLSFYTNREDTTALQDMTLELSRIDLKEFRRILPYMPDMEGLVGAEAHYVDSGTEGMMLGSDVQVEGFCYEGSALGDWELGGVWLPGGEGEHHLDAYVRHDGNEIAHVGGFYLTAEQEEGSLNADVSLSHFPLKVANPFMPDHVVELGGRFDGTLTAKGSLSAPVVNGQLAMDSVSLSLPEMSVLFRFDNEPVEVVDSRMLFRDFRIFTLGKSPFTLNGHVDFSRPERLTTDLSMRAEDYELLNAPRTKRALVYGKMYVDFDAVLRGPVDELVMRGNMNVLGKTDFTYVLKDSPLTVNDRLGDMVTFVNFADTAAVDEPAAQVLSLGGMDIAMTVHIDQAVQARVDLVPDGSNYMLLEGGGDLSFQYTPQGDMLLTGRYSLMSGEMKYEIPVIPLKTFHIRNGSYVEWTGNIMNPQLSLEATERVRASVGESGKSSRMVGFDVGIALSQRLENLGLAFTLSAPEDASVQDQLNAMSAEERGKLAVTMLVTGMYMAEGNSTGGFNVNSALNTFLQNEISNIAGRALDINVGMETVDDADGSGKRTDYNFQFAKRFWNNRFRIVIGGKVSTGSTVQQDETFIDNVSLEYRLDNSGTRYVKVFHDKNYESILEGEITETGVGVVLRKKMSRLGELFIFRSGKKKTES